MFRDAGMSKMNDEHFGCGSIMSFGSDKYLIIGSADKHVSLLSLNTFQRFSGSLTVADINYLSEAEVRALHTSINDQTTFSDYEFDTKGLKWIK